MPLKELEHLTRELTDLTEMLRAETRRSVRWEIIRRVQEILSAIQEGMNE